MKVLLVTGTRTDERRGEVSAFIRDAKPDLVLVGEQTGVDSEAADYCREHGIDYVIVPALWHSNGPAAGPRRNALLAMLGAAVRALYGNACELSFVALPWGEAKGTRSAKKAFVRRQISGVVLGKLDEE